MGQSLPRKELPKGLRLVREEGVLSFYALGSEEYLQLQVLLQPNNPRHSSASLSALLERRSALAHVPALQYYQGEKYSLCNEFTLLRMLFRHPVKHLAQEIQNRKQNNSALGEGQLWMVLYCAVLCLKEYLSYAPSYQIEIASRNLYICTDGNIVLTDAHRFQQEFKETTNQLPLDSLQHHQLNALGTLMANVAAAFPHQTYSQQFTSFLSALQNQIRLYEEALAIMRAIKKKKGDHSYTPNKIKVSPIIHLLSSNKKSACKIKSIRGNKENIQQEQKQTKNSSKTLSNTSSDLSSIAIDRNTEEDDVFQLIEIFEPQPSQKIVLPELLSNRKAIKLLTYNPHDIIYEVSQDTSQLNSHRTANNARQASNAFSNDEQWPRYQE